VIPYGSRLLWITLATNASIVVFDGDVSQGLKLDNRTNIRCCPRRSIVSCHRTQLVRRLTTFGGTHQSTITRWVGFDEGSTRVCRPSSHGLERAKRSNAARPSNLSITPRVQLHIISRILWRHGASFSSRSAHVVAGTRLVIEVWSKGVGPRRFSSG